MGGVPCEAHAMAATDRPPWFFVALIPAPPLGGGGVVVRLAAAAAEGGPPRGFVLFFVSGRAGFPPGVLRKIEIIGY